MAKVPAPLNATVDAVYRWREQTTSGGHREHLGASIIGHPCDRNLWLTWRWAESEKFEGRVLRLFDTGKREEPRVIEELRGIGCEVFADDGGTQFRVSAVGGHFGGSMDGVVSGLPEAPKSPHVLEIKTHSAKSFADLLKKGVEKAKPMHFVQMQTYMALASLDRALYYAVNKDTDDVYTERVALDPGVAAKILERATKIIHASEPPLRVSEDPAYFECKWCKFHTQCHGDKAPEVNCRTCAHSTPLMTDGDGSWACEKFDCSLPVENQRHGCADHRFIPILLERLGKFEGMDGDLAIYTRADGVQFANGDPPDGFTSDEIRAVNGASMLVDRQVRELREEFPGARIVETNVATAFDDMEDDIPW